MRISYLLFEFGKTGGPIVLYNFMDNLVKRGHEVYAVLPDKRIKWEVGIWKELLENETPNSKENSNSRLFNIFYSLKTAISQKKADIFNVDHDKNVLKGILNNWIESDVTISTFCLTAYIAYYLSDKTVPVYHMQHFEEIFYQTKKERLVARNTYFLPIIKLANSSWLKNILQKKFGQSSYLLNPGIDLSLFKVHKDIHEKYKPKKEWTIISYFDETREWKGFKDAVLAMRIAMDYFDKKDIKLKWKVFGIYPPFKEYDVPFEYVGRVFGDDLAKLYSQSDITLLTSWYESFPLPPIEAMACGSLVITTRYGSEDYVFNNKNGLVCMPRKESDIASKIIYAIENPDKCLEMVGNGLDTVQNYNWEKRTDVLEEILEEAVDNYSFEQLRLFDDLVKGDFKEYMHKEFEI